MFDAELHKPKYNIKQHLNTFFNINAVNINIWV